MTLTLPHWITVDGVAGDLAVLAPKLDAYAELAQHWQALAAEIWKAGATAPVDSPVKLAVYIADKLDDPAIVEVFTGLGLDALRQKVSALGAHFIDPAAPWSKLLQPADSFAESYGDTSVNGLDDGANPGLVALTIPPVATDGTVAARLGSLTFGVSAAEGLECEAGAVWPFRDDAVTPGLLRIGAGGTVTAKAGFTIPFGQIGSGHASASSSAAARLDFFYRPSNTSAPFADLVLPALTGIPNPLDLSDISHAIELAALEGIVLACDGAATAGLGTTIGASYDIPDIASLTAGAVAEVTFKRNARWLLSLRKTASGLHFVLSRNLSRERDWSVGLDLAVNNAALARQVHDVLVKADGLSQPLLAQIKPFLSPGTYLTTHAKDLLDKAVASIASEESLRTALAMDIGLILGTGKADDLALAGYLRTRISDLAAAQADGVLGDAEHWARGIAADLTAKFPALAPADLLDRLVARIKPMLGDVQTRFKGLLDHLVTVPGLAAELKSAGIAVAAGEQQADVLLAGVRKLVDTFETFAQDLIAKTGEGVEHKLQARFGWSGGISSGVQYELRGTFADTSAPCAALWRALVTGQLEPFQRILANPVNAPPGLTLDPASSLARFAGQHAGFSLEIVVFDFKIAFSSIAAGKASIVTSAAGDLSVSAQGDAARAIDGFTEGRAASFVNAWDLALRKVDSLSGGQRTMSVAVAFDHHDRNLDVNEVTGFLGALAAQGLVETSRIARAQEVYQEWRTATPPGKNVEGRIDVRMALPGVAVDRMVTLGRGAATRSVRQATLFGLAGRALVAAGVSSDDGLARDCRKARDNFDGFEHVMNTWDIVYAMPDDYNRPSGSIVTGSDRYPAFEQIIPRAISFPRLLAIMAQIYDAIPVGVPKPGPVWSERDYAKAEIALADQARIWLRLNTKLFAFKASLHPVMIAFLKLLADMNRPLVGTTDPIQDLDSHADTASSNALFCIMMTRAGESSAV